jgi:hypothetical protein
MDALARSIDKAEAAGGALVELNEPSQVGIRDQIAKARDILQGQYDRLEGYLFETCWLCQKRDGDYDEGLCFECMTAIENGMHHKVMAPIYMCTEPNGQVHIFVRATQADGVIIYEHTTRRHYLPVDEWQIVHLNVVETFNWIANANEAGRQVTAFYTVQEYEHGFEDGEPGDDGQKCCICFRENAVPALGGELAGMCMFCSAAFSHGEDSLIASHLRKGYTTKDGEYNLIPVVPTNIVGPWMKLRVRDRANVGVFDPVQVAAHLQEKRGFWMPFAK